MKAVLWPDKDSNVVRVTVILGTWMLISAGDSFCADTKTLLQPCDIVFDCESVS